METHCRSRAGQGGMSTQHTELERTELPKRRMVGRVFLRSPAEGTSAPGKETPVPRERTSQKEQRKKTVDSQKRIRVPTTRVENHVSRRAEG